MKYRGSINVPSYLVMRLALSVCFSELMGNVSSVGFVVLLVIFYLAPASCDFGKPFIGKAGLISIDVPRAVALMIMVLNAILLVASLLYLSGISHPSAGAIGGGLMMALFIDAVGVLALYIFGGTRNARSK